MQDAQEIMDAAGSAGKGDVSFLIGALNLTAMAAFVTFGLVKNIAWPETSR